MPYKITFNIRLTFWCCEYHTAQKAKSLYYIYPQKCVIPVHANHNLQSVKFLIWQSIAFIFCLFCFVLGVDWAEITPEVIENSFCTCSVNRVICAEKWFILKGIFKTFNFNLYLCTICLFWLERISQNTGTYS